MLIFTVEQSDAVTHIYIHSFLDLCLMLECGRLAELCESQVYSRVIQLHVHVCLLFSKFISHSGCYRVSRRAPCALQQVLADCLLYTR